MPKSILYTPAASAVETQVSWPTGMPLSALLLKIIKIKFEYTKTNSKLVKELNVKTKNYKTLRRTQKTKVSQH